MQVEGKRDGATPDIAAGLNGREVDIAAASIVALHEIIKDVEGGLPFSAVRQAYATPLDSLVKLAGRRRDVNMLARLHGLISILETGDHTAEQNGLLIGQIDQVEKMLQGWTAASKPAARGIITGQGTAATVDILPYQPGYCEELLRTHPSIDDREVQILQEHGLLDAERLLKTDALELARITGISTNTAFEIKNLLRNNAEQRASQDMARRVAELTTINEQLSAECDRLIAANNTLLASNKNLKNQYPVVSEKYDLELSNFKALQSRVISTRIESNRLSTEINFLRDEHQKLLDIVEEKHVLLDDLFRRFNSIRSSYEFVSGETGFAEDIMMNVEGLLNKALKQKKSLHDKIALSEESMEKLFSAFNSIVKKGKMEFYRNI
ncbi:MAG TPA: hypothetical protein VJZ49_08855 [Syntrophales bacterium]|nr:hypothetical protein [Syntrophales bacterium]